MDHPPDRAAYNLWGTPFDDLSTYPRARASATHTPPTSDHPEARKVFANSRTVAEAPPPLHRIESEPLYHPPPRAEGLRCDAQGDYIFYPGRLEPQKRQSF